MKQMSGGRNNLSLYSGSWNLDYEKLWLVLNKILLID